MELNAVLFIPFVFIVASLTIRGLDGLDRAYALRALGAHAVVSFVYWGLCMTVYQGMDVFGYQKAAQELLKLLSADLMTFGPEVIKHFVHIEDAFLPAPFPLGGGTAGSLESVAAVMAIFGGSSLIALCLMGSLAGWVGQVCIYRVAREELEPGDRVPLAVSCLFMPSPLFWCSGLSKEAVAVGFLGILMLATYRMLHAPTPLKLLGIALGAVGVAMLKPYILFGFVAGLAVAIYADRAWRDGTVIRIRPLYLVLAGCVALAGVVAMGEVVPDMSASNLAETLAQRQAVWKGLDDLGGSAAEIGSGDARSPLQQLAFVPLAMLNVYFRPVLFEARNGPMILAALENSYFFFVLWSILSGGKARAVVQTVLRTPFLVFGVAFTLVFGVGVGLATSNLGSVSRYRVPMMPFYVGTMFVLRSRFQRAATAAAPRLRAVIRRSHAG